MSARARIKLPPYGEQILLGLAEGMKTQEMADDMGLAHSTVDAYRKRLLRALGARTQGHAVALAYHHGLLIPKDRV